MPAKRKNTVAKGRTKAAPAKRAVMPDPAIPASVKRASTEVKITPVKGRPMLQWVGKRPLRSVTAFPALLVESVDPLGSGQPGGLLYHGDNKEVLAHLLANGFRGKVNLIYIDPPFDSGADYVRKIMLRGKSALAKLDGEGYTLGEQVQYTDIWANDNYLQFMYERLLLLKELLSEDGVLFLHCDDSKSHYLRCVLEEVFTPAGYRNEIIWKRTTARSGSGQFNHIHDTLFFFAKGEKNTWNQQYLPYSKEYLESNFRPDDRGVLFRETPLTAPGTRTGSSGRSWKNLNPSLIGRGRHWSIPDFIKPKLSAAAMGDTQIALDELERMGRIRWAKDGEGRPNLIQYFNDLPGVELQTIWTDFGALSSNAEESEEYPTQKPEALVERIVRSCSKAGDLVLDCFIGSGTTAAVAQKLGRRWIGSDINKGAIQTTSKRLQSIITEQIAAQRRQSQTELIANENAPPAPAQLSFQIHRVNDYDLQIQHNEAVALACEHIGVERKKADRFFDGIQGKRLVKVISFNHPLSPVDLEELSAELRARRDEERDILLVCLGKELACDAWLAEWNRLRKRGDVPNKIEVIELRTDAKYGKFFAHKPPSAKVKIERKQDELHVEIQDFISPSILERLETQAGLLTARITDWRSMVDSVMIDPAFDGSVFRIALTDLPEEKTDFVQGRYTLPAPKGETNVAVKITDMLGEEIVIQQRI
jgi:DNA modification methylase